MVSGALLLAACATSPRESGRVVPGEPAAVAERLASRMPALGLRVSEQSPAGLQAAIPQAPRDWAICSPRLVSGGDDRRVMSSAGSRQGEVRVTLAADGSGTLVTVLPEFSATYRNPIRGMSFSAPCRSGGVLEPLLLQAAEP